MNKTNSRTVKTVVLLATLFVTNACSSGLNPASSDNDRMQAITEERAPTAKELEVAEALTTTPVEITTDSKITEQKDELSTIAGLNEVIELGKYMGPKGALVASAGKVIWNVIEKNQASVELSSQRLSILPTDARLRSQLAGWQRPVTRAFTVRLQNLMGAEVVKYDYAIAYSYGGHVNGKGRYISNLTVIHSDLRVLWGFNIDAQFVTGTVENFGKTADNPVVGVMGELRWKVKNVFTNVRKSNAFWIFGNGNFQRLNKSEKEIVVAIANDQP